MTTEVDLDGESDSTALTVARDWLWVPVLAAIVGLFVVVGYLIHPLHPEPTAPVRSTFTDSAGRACTQVVTGSAVAIDCDFPPAENRLGGFLNDLDNP